MLYEDPEREKHGCDELLFMDWKPVGHTLAHAHAIIQQMCLMKHLARCAHVTARGANTLTWGS